MSIIEYSPNTHDIVTVSMHYYEQDKFKVSLIIRLTPSRSLTHSLNHPPTHLLTHIPTRWRHRKISRSNWYRRISVSIRRIDVSSCDSTTIDLLFFHCDRPTDCSEVKTS